MSLVRISARLAIVRALRGVTMAGEHVYDSLIGGIQVDADGQLNIGEGEERPFIAVFTDGAKNEKPQLRSFAESGMTEIVIEWGISAGMVEKDPVTGESHIVAGLVATDDAIEFTLDLIGREIADALNDPANEWADIWRSIASGGFTKTERARTSNDRDGTRLAAHQMRITSMLMDEPGKGEDLPDPFPLLFEKLSASEDAVDNRIGAMMAAVLGLSDPDWLAVQRARGLTFGDLLAVGLGPVDGDEDLETPAMTAGTLVVNDGDPIEVSGS
ncbi:hypothetical protein [uncultured Hoeflea sp.]|uniref:hypothetical protein n=1 Tax=uncultured Hoeflea sp. TaxID=538666 RepID=UPI0030DB5F3D